MVTNMQLSENEKSLFDAKKVNISILTSEIFDLLINCKINKTEILKRMFQIIFNLRDLCAISADLILKPELITFKDGNRSHHRYQPDAGSPHEKGYRIRTRIFAQEP
jgi:hypothetical protein